MARRGELLVEEDANLFAPVEKEHNKWALESVLPEDAIAELLRVPPHEAHRLLIEADVPVFRTRERLFGAQKLWRTADIKQKLEAFTATHGLPPEEAALELGLTMASYRPLVNNILFHSNDRVLKVLLEAYRNKFLPRDKIWSTRTSLLKEFVDSFNRANPKAPLGLQLCDVDDCGHVASAQCMNAQCRDGKPQRFVCPAHEVWVDVQVQDIRRRPPALCPSCAEKVRSGHLHSFTLL